MSDTAPCPTLLPLTCAVQKYAWGKPAADSLVAQLTGATESNENYAELWMGTHPKGPSSLTSGELLVDWISKDPTHRLGGVAGTFNMDNGGLPFLLKVLSVGKALSIQAHPTIEHAKHLHATLPQHYPDANHKPEMAIALTIFEGLCGFRPIVEIQQHLKHLYSLNTDLRDILQEQEPTSEDYIKHIFCTLIVSPRLPEIVSQIYGALQGKEHLPADELFLKIYKQHPGDRGLICIYLLNHVILAPGECMFLGPNKIHAYFSGDCIECMACSDNTVRSGLTPKFIDVDTLCDMLDYTPGTATSQKLLPSSTSNITSYIPPIYGNTSTKIKDFSVDRIQVDSVASIPGKASCAILLCVEGQGTLAVGTDVQTVAAGAVFYLTPDTALIARGNMLLFQAYCQE